MGRAGPDRRQPGAREMIYPTKERAEQVAAELNQRRGYHEARAYLGEHGWTIGLVNADAGRWSAR